MFNFEILRTLQNYILWIEENPGHWNQLNFDPLLRMVTCLSVYQATPNKIQEWYQLNTQTNRALNGAQPLA